MFSPAAAIFLNVLKYLNNHSIFYRTKKCLILEESGGKKFEKQLGFFCGTMTTAETLNFFVFILFLIWFSVLLLFYYKTIKVRDYRACSLLSGKCSFNVFCNIMKQETFIIISEILKISKWDTGITKLTSKQTTQKQNRQESRPLSSIFMWFIHLIYRKWVFS